MNDDAGAALDRAADPIRASASSASSTRTPRRRGGCTRRASSWCTASGRRPCASCSSGRTRPDPSSASRRRRPSSTGCRRSPAGTPGRGSSPTRSGWCRPARSTSRCSGTDRARRRRCRRSSCDTAPCRCSRAAGSPCSVPSLLDADLVVLRRRPAAVHADEVFLARELELHRRAGLLREHRGDQIGVLVLVLVAEVAAHVLADDADLLLRDAEIARHVGAAVGDAAGRRVDGQLVAVPGGDADARLHLGVVHERRSSSDPRRRGRRPRSRPRRCRAWRRSAPPRCARSATGCLPARSAARPASAPLPDRARTAAPRSRPRSAAALLRRCGDRPRPPRPPARRRSAPGC